MRHILAIALALALAPRLLVNARENLVKKEKRAR